MQEKRKATPKKIRTNERRSDLQIIRTKVSQTEIYLWTLCLVFMGVILTTFVFISLLFEKGGL